MFDGKNCAVLFALCVVRLCGGDLIRYIFSHLFPDVCIYLPPYCATRKHVKDATADVTPQEAENVSLFDSYMASR